MGLWAVRRAWGGTVWPGAKRKAWGAARTVRATAAAVGRGAWGCPRSLGGHGLVRGVGVYLYIYINMISY